MGLFFECNQNVTCRSNSIAPLVFQVDAININVLEIVRCGELIMFTVHIWNDIQEEKLNMAG